jgi:glycerophosphoryl diester phosphodiesterase
MMPRFEGFDRMKILFLLAAGCLSARCGHAVEIVAHRGGFLLAPENTCAAFRACAGAADRIEFDVHVSADGHLVVIHDPTVNRTTTGYGAVTNVAHLTLAQLKTLDAGAKFSPAFAGERIPTLAEALAAVPPGIPVLVDRKSGSPEAFVQALRDADRMSTATLASGGWMFLVEAKKLDPGIQLMAGGGAELIGNGLSWLRGQGIHAVSLPSTDMNKDILDRIHAVGLAAYVPVATGPEIRKFADMGIDGLLAEDPRLAKDIARDKPSERPQISRGLVAYWKLDDGLADDHANAAEDVEGNSSGRLVGFGYAPGWLSRAEARMGGALRFDGVGQFVRIPPSEPLDIGTNAVSISLWVKLSKLPSQLPAPIAGIYDSAENAYGLYLDRQARELRFNVTDATRQAARVGIPEALLRTGVWHHVVGVYDGGASPAAGLTAIYLDGGLHTVRVGAEGALRRGLTGPVLPGQVAALGRKGSEDLHYFAGALDDVAVWRRALRPAEIRQIHQAGRDGVPLGRLVASVSFTRFQPSADLSDIEIDVSVEFGLLEDGPIHLRSAPSVAGPYVDHAVLEKRWGRSASFRISSMIPSPHPSAPSDFGSVRFFQIVQAP